MASRNQSAVVRGRPPIHSVIEDARRAARLQVRSVVFGHAAERGADAALRSLLTYLRDQAEDFIEEGHSYPSSAIPAEEIHCLLAALTIMGG